MDIQSNLKEVRAQLPPQVSLVAVSKFHPNEAILAAYETGQRIFGESKEQELSKQGTGEKGRLPCPPIFSGISSATCRPIK